MPIGNDYFPAFSEKEYARRRQTIRVSMKEHGLDCLIVYGAYSVGGTDTGQSNAVYLANYAGVGHSYVVLPLEEDPTLVIGLSLHIPNARDCSVIDDIRAGGADLIPAVADRITELGLEKGNIGIVGPLMSCYFNNTIPVEHYNYLTETFPKAGFRTSTEIYDTCRLEKSEEEIALMDKAGKLTDMAHEELFMATRPGIRHSDLRQIVEGVAGRFGGKYPFSHVGSTPMANPERFYPDFYPTHRTIEAGDVVMTEISAGYGTYFGKIWGTFFVGGPTDEYVKLFELAVSVHDTAIREIKPGMAGRDVNKWLEPFKEAGYINFTNLVMGWSNLNHAPHVGALEGSPPAARIKQSDLDFVFKPGHCVTVVAFPVDPDTKRGLWVGTTCVFTKSGLRKLHAYPVNKMRMVPV